LLQLPGVVAVGPGVKRHKVFAAGSRGRICQDPCLEKRRRANRHQIVEIIVTLISEIVISTQSIHDYLQVLVELKLARNDVKRRGFKLAPEKIDNVPTYVVQAGPFKECLLLAAFFFE
jgi:hypothetical protein